MTTHVRFKSIESKYCFVVWVLSVLYAIYNFICTSQQYFLNYEDSYNDFAEGWSILGYRKRDKADFEWETIGFLLRNLYPYIIMYLGINEFLRYQKFNIKSIQCLEIIFSLTLVHFISGWIVVALVLVQPILFILVGQLNNSLFIWICNSLCISLIIIHKNISVSEEYLKFLNLNHYEVYLTILLLCWLNLKCTSFFLSSADKNILKFLSYCFYCPTLFVGPFISYNDFQHTFLFIEYENLEIRMKKLVGNFLRIAFWYIFGNFALHFIYINATSFQIELVSNMDLWSLCGYGYLMGQLFHIKYVVLYGLSTSLASFENVKVPNLPRCIGRVHLYSDMWKYFDPGLYRFLKTYIFTPSYNKFNNKFLSSFLCFLFVYVWHGIEYYILIWAVMNYIGVCLEAFVGIVYQTKMKSSGLIRNMTSENLRRVKCALAAPLLALSAISNFYFFAGKDVGEVFWNQAFNGSLTSKLYLLTILYCCCQSSTEVRDIQANVM